MGLSVINMRVESPQLIRPVRVTWPPPIHSAVARATRLPLPGAVGQGTETDLQTLLRKA